MILLFIRHSIDEKRESAPTWASTHHYLGRLRALEFIPRCAGHIPHLVAHLVECLLFLASSYLILKACAGMSFTLYWMGVALGGQV